MKHLTVTLILCGLALASALDAQINRVTKPENREDLLARADRILNAAPPDFANLPRQRENPFTAVPRSQPEAAEEPSEVELASQTPRAGRLSDERALAAVDRNFPVSGSLIAGDRKLLRLRNGNSMREGASFTARIQGEAYEVFVSAVTPDGYTLRIGEATLERRFLENRSISGSSVVPENAAD